MFRFIPIIIKWMPLVISAITTVESLFGSGMTGAQKKEKVLAWLSRLAKERNLPWGEDAINVISDLIDTVVGIMNFVGLFRNREAVEFNELGEQEELASSTAPASTANVAKAKEQDPELAAFLEKMGQ